MNNPEEKLDSTILEPTQGEKRPEAKKIKELCDKILKIDDLNSPQNKDLILEKILNLRYRQKIQTTDLMLLIRQYLIRREAPVETMNQVLELVSFAASFSLEPEDFEYFNEKLPADLSIRAPYLVNKFVQYRNLALEENQNRKKPVIH